MSEKRSYVPPSRRKQQEGSFSVESDSNESPSLKPSTSAPAINISITPKMPFKSIGSEMQHEGDARNSTEGYDDGTKSTVFKTRSLECLLHQSNSVSNFSTRQKSSYRTPDKLDLLTPPPPQILFKNSSERNMVIDYSSMESGKVKVEYPRQQQQQKGNDGKGKYQDVPFKDFNESTLKALDFPQALIDNVKRLRYEKPTPIQVTAVPLILSSMDILATSQTGSGKTFSFLAPIVAKLLNSNEKSVVSEEERNSNVAYPLAVVLSPTRELTQQIALMCFQLTHRTDLTVRLVYGGEGSREQGKLLRKACDIIIATPGRLKDFLEKGCLNLKYAKTLVLDEADRMLDMGFEPQIRELVHKFQMPGNGANGARQTLMFSATFEKAVQNMVTRYLHNEARIHIGQIGSTTTTIKQCFEYFPETGARSMERRIQQLIDILTTEEFRPTSSFLTLVFVETKRDVSHIVTCLLNAGIQVCEMHGDIEQRDRQNNLKSFKDGRTPVLVATDVAQRGIDIGSIRHVINFDFPKDIDTYIHRIGRTGRAGAEGLATSFITPGVSSYLLNGLKDTLVQAKQPIPRFIQDGPRATGGYKSSGSNSYGNKSYRPQRRDTCTDFDDSYDCESYGHDSRSRGYKASEAATPSVHVTPVKVEEQPATRWD